MLNHAMEVSGTGEYDPFGALNRVHMFRESPHPYTMSTDYVFSNVGRPSVGGMKVDVRAHLREPPLGEVGVARVKLVRDRELEHAVAEKLEPLVGLRPVQRPRRVGERSPPGRAGARRSAVRARGVACRYWCDET